MGRGADSRFLWLAVAAPCAALLAWRAVQELWVTDDALITFRYVENLAAGHGLVYNLGERVEGLSNPLFAFVLWPFAAAGADLFRVAPAIGIVASVVEVAVLVWLGWRTTRSLLWAGLAGALFASDRIVVVWATGGLETAVHGALLLGAFALARLALERPDAPRLVAAATLMHVLVAASRPEGAAFYGAFLVLLAWRTRGAASRGRAVTRSLGWFLVPVLALVAARLAYYGQPLPNTFHAKVGGVPTLDLGLVYLAGFARRMGWTEIPHVLVWIAFAVALGWALRRGLARLREEAPRIPPLLAQSLAYVALALVVVVVEGGDYMTDFRMLRPVVGILWLGVACALAAVDAAAPPRGRIVAAAVALALLASHVVRQNEGSAVAWDAPPAAEHKRILAVDRARAEEFAQALMTVAEPGDSLLVDLAGFRGYAHRLRTIDATGLLSPDVEEDFYLRDDWNEWTGGRERLPGHARWPKVGFLEREGVTFIFPKVQARGPEVPEVTERSPRRHRGYPFLHVVAPLGDGRHLRFFTTMDRDGIAARAREKGVTLCARERFGPLECFGPPGG